MDSMASSKGTIVLSLIWTFIDFLLSSYLVVHEYRTIPEKRNVKNGELKNFFMD
jgi:hypothetical protein